MEHVRVVGTSHIAKKSVDRIKIEFLEFKPDFIAIELDRNRLEALLSGAKPSMNPKMIRQVGVLGYLFAVVGGIIQRKLGKMVNMNPGADMLQGALLAKNNHLPLLLLDQDIRITLHRLSKQITWREKGRLMGDLLFGWAKKQQKITVSLEDVPDEALIATMLGMLKERYPTFHRVLLQERNEYMARRLAAAVLAQPQKKFLVVLGAGHEEGFAQDVEKAIAQLRKAQKEAQTQPTSQ